MDTIRMWLGFVMMVIGGIGFVLLFAKAVWDYFFPHATTFTATEASSWLDLLAKLDQRYIAAATLVFLGYMLFDPVGFPGLTGGGGASASPAP